MHGVEGPINIAGYIFVTYFSEIEWSDVNPALLTQNINAHLFDNTQKDAWEYAKQPCNYNLMYPNGLSAWQQQYDYAEAEPPPGAKKSVRYVPYSVKPSSSDVSHSGGQGQLSVPLPGTAPGPQLAPFGAPTIYIQER